MTDRATIMVCSVCNHVMARAIPGTEFDIFDCGWRCPQCGQLWLSSDFWEERGPVLMPHRENASAL